MAAQGPTSPPSSPLHPSHNSEYPLDADGAGVATHPKIVSFRSSFSHNRESIDAMNEQSPLLRPRSSDEEDSGLKVVSPLSDEGWQGGNDEETKSSWYLLLLTLSGLG
jgi:solute carrier family 45, member 1/2/4